MLQHGDTALIWATLLICEHNVQSIQALLEHKRIDVNATNKVAMGGVSVGYAWPHQRENV